LGAIHALEPGHAKSLMAAYIVAIRGTAKQVVVLASSATAGHTITLSVRRTCFDCGLYHDRGRIKCRWGVLVA